jgi:hypothetical protein
MPRDAGNEVVAEVEAEGPGEFLNARHGIDQDVQFAGVIGGGAKGELEPVRLPGIDATERVGRGEREQRLVRGQVRAVDGTIRESRLCRFPCAPRQRVPDRPTAKNTHGLQATEMRPGQRGAAKVAC